MVFEFRLPDIGEGIVEATIVDWLVTEGDSVKNDQIIVKIETDKAVADLPSPIAGTILKINFLKSALVNVGATLCLIGEKGEKIEIKKNETIIEKIFEKSVISEKVLASPVVRKSAIERGIDLSSIKSSGDGGRILLTDLDISANVKVDVQKSANFVSQKKYDLFGYVERVPFKGVRKIIAQNMIKSLQQTAPVTSMDDIDVTKLWALRQREKEHFALEGIKLTFMPFVIKAVISALQKHPILNSSLEGDEIIIKKYFNIGVAVQTDVGLMVPVVKIAEKKSVSEIAKEITNLAEKCRDRTIDIMDLKGSTFTITNYGSIGGNYGTPIINLGEAGILGLGSIFDKVVLDEESEKVRNVKILPVSLTFDHQIIDGAQAVDFLKTLKNLLEEPNQIFG